MEQNIKIDRRLSKIVKKKERETFLFEMVFWVVVPLLTISLLIYGISNKIKENRYEQKYNYRNNYNVQYNKMPSSYSASGTTPINIQINPIFYPAILSMP
ncbi:MAG: hypothetical protein WC346_09225 [Methanogenium sp.]|jgi:hypothetical protein